VGHRKKDNTAGRFLPLLNERSKWSSDNLVYWVTDAEAAILFSEVVTCQPEVVLEAGTANGWTAAWMSLALDELNSEALIHTFDIVDKPHIEPLSRVRYYLEPFHIGGARLAANYINERKLIFIDGDHSGIGVHNDYEAIASYLNKGDVVIFHDTQGELGCYTKSKKIRRIGNYTTFRHYYTRNGISSYQI
jgi:hypothetical protein